MRGVAAIVFVLVASLTTFAQPRGPGGRGSAGPTLAERREAIKNRIRGKRAEMLTEKLKLDDKALARLLPLLSKWDDVTDKLLVERIDLQKRFATADQLKDPKAIDKLIDDAIANQKAFWDLEDKRLAEIRKVLTPQQVAKLLVVLPAFERRIQNQLRNAILRKSGAPAIDEDDDLEPDEVGPTTPRRR